MRFSLDKHKPMFYKRAVNHKGVMMNLHEFLTRASLFSLFVIICLLLVVGVEHIIYDHQLFGLLK
jgi:hypothetical protein